MNVLVTGGAGFVGSVLVPDLLARGHRVRVIDSLMYGGRGLLPCFRYPDFEFVRGDVRDEPTLKKALRDVELVIHLAAVVGYPACKKDPELARSVNVGGTEALDTARGSDIPVVFASTGSNYGAVVGDICTESTPLNPVSIYGETKVQAEKVLMDSGNAVALRFATGFGVSNRMRLDLLVNDFCYQAVKTRNLVVYEKTFKRTFIHVSDMSRAFVHAVDNLDAVRDGVYNVGDESMNLSKEDVARAIREKVEFFLYFADFGSDEDKRNYEVSYEKVRATGYSTRVGISEGVGELLRALEAVEVRHDYSNV